MIIPRIANLTLRQTCNKKYLSLARVFDFLLLVLLAPSSTEEVDRAESGSKSTKSILIYPIDTRIEERRPPLPKREQKNDAPKFRVPHHNTSAVHCRHYNSTFRTNTLRFNIHRGYIAWLLTDYSYCIFAMKPKLKALSLLKKIFFVCNLY